MKKKLSKNEKIEFDKSVKELQELDDLVYRLLKKGFPKITITKVGKNERKD